MKHVLTFLSLAIVVKADPPKAKVPVGPDTTIVDGPLTKDGWIDYAAALNTINSKDVTTQNNAQVLLMQILGPKVIFEEARREKYFQLLGVPVPPLVGNYFVSFDRDYAKGLKLDAEGLNALNQEFVAALKNAWQPEKYPRIEAWMNANAPFVDLIAKATLRPKYYSPAVLSPNKNGPGTLLSRHMDEIQRARELAAFLSLRVKRSLHEKRFDEAWKDCLTIHRLGRLISRGGTGIESLVGHALETIALNLEAKIAAAADWSSRDWNNRLKELDELPSRRIMVETLDIGERFNGLDSIQEMFRDRDDPEIRVLEIDTMMAVGKPWYDRMILAMRLPTRAERKAELAKIKAELDNVAKALNQVKPRTARIASENVGLLLTSLMMPSLVKLQNAEERVIQLTDLVRLSLVLGAYRKNHGTFPAKLELLTPKYLPTIPNDLFSGKALQYVIKPNGFVLYSVGVNGKDDGGAGSDAEPPGDDLTIRVLAE